MSESPRERHARLKALFLDARELESAARVALLERVGAGSPDDRAELEALFAASAVGAESPAPPAPRLRPGDVFAGRYRVEAALGSGGAGEVYRAEDLVVGGPVALKLLRAGRRGRSDVVLNEVRLARRITHPAVCRVHDVGVAGDEYFITLEYVEGEDLAARLRRSGSVPPAEALALARQLAAGLAAAHARGVLHRDLKPANILLDGEGRARVTDFGIATTAAQRGPAGGTPSYMAPEQFLPGGLVSEQTDLYALGLVLHEAVTGRPAFGGPDGVSFEERLRFHPPPLDRLVAGVDPALARVVRALTHPDARRRPGSALAVAAALADGDPLQIAVETGSTVSPEVIAATSLEHEGLRPRAALGAFAATVAMVAATLALGTPGWSRAVSGLGPGPRALDARLGQVLASAGLPAGEPVESGFIENFEERGTARRIQYWKKLSLPTSDMTPLERASRSVPDNFGVTPPRAELLASVDLEGRLVSLQIDRVPAPGGPAGAPAAPAAPEAEFDVAILLRAAGLDPARLVPQETDLPAVFATDRRAFVGPDPADPAREVLVQAAAAGRVPVRFAVAAAAPVAARQAERLAGPPVLLGIVIVFALQLASLVLGASNLRRRSADRRGARRLYIALAAMHLTVTVLLLDHAADPAAELTVVERFAGALLAPVPALFGYLGLEPWARRFRPRMLIGWNRLLAGRVVDPLVGRGILFGTLAGAALAAVDGLDRLFVASLGFASLFPDVAAHDLTGALGARALVATTLTRIPDAAWLALPLALLLVIARVWLPRRVAGPAVFAAYTLLLWSLIGNATPSLVLGAPLSAAIALVVLDRAGLLSVVVAAAVGYGLTSVPALLAPSAWYFAPTAATLALTLALAAAGSVLATTDTGGGRAPLSAPALRVSTPDDASTP